MIDPVHPSEFIQEEINARGWSRADLANAMGMDRCALNLLTLDMYFAVGPTQTNCRLGADTVERLGRAFGVSPQFFINLQARWLKDMADTTALRGTKKED